MVNCAILFRFILTRKYFLTTKRRFLGNMRLYIFILESRYTDSYRIFEINFSSRRNVSDKYIVTTYNTIVSKIASYMTIYELKIIAIIDKHAHRKNLKSSKFVDIFIY